MMSLCGVIVVLGLFPQTAVAIVAGQTDTFENGTTQGWISGAVNPHPPVNIATGGPQGAGDHFLKVTSSGGFGTGSKLVAFNTTQWTGNYTATDIVAIEMDLSNLGSTDIVIRLAMSGSGGEIASLIGISLPSASGWQHVRFSVTAADFAKLLSTGNINTTLAGVMELRILHSTTPQYRGDSISAVLGIDNIKALAGLPVCGDANHPYPIGDLNKDCYVNLQDLILWSGQWLGANCAVTQNCHGADLDSGGMVDLSDLGVMAAEWLSCTSPDSPCNFNP